MDEEFPCVVVGIGVAIHFCRRFSKARESSRRKPSLFDRMPCLRAFIDDLERPSGVFGPVDLRLFRRLASILA